MTGRGDFWSRRKAKVAAEEESLAREAAAPEPDERTDEDILADLDLPDPDSLEAGDDFSRFMAAAVPERLRRRALRRLWRSNPALANLDALVDYGEDFTDAGMVTGIVATTYQVGRGMTRHIEELARQAEAEAAEQDPVAEAAPGPIALTEAEPDCETQAEQEPEPETTEADPQPAAQPPRRMKFQFAV